MKKKKVNEYFEENDMEGFNRKFESYDFCLNYVTELTELEDGQKLVRFYDPSGYVDSLNL